MRIILKPAGILLVLGLLTVMVAAVAAKRQKAEIRKAEELPPLPAFQSLKKTKTANLFNNEDELTPVNLTETGKLDWVHWGGAAGKAVTRKSDSRRLIGDVTFLNPKGGVLPEGKRGPSRGMLWSDGSPRSESPVNYDAIHVDQAGGFRFTVAADTKPRTLRVYVGGYKTGPQFTAKLSDGTSPTIKRDDKALGNGYFTRIYEVAFQAKKPGDRLSVEWRKSDLNNRGNLSLQAAALE